MNRMQMPVKAQDKEWTYSVFQKSKELSLCHEFWFSNPYNFATQCRRSLIFETMNYVI